MYNLYYLDPSAATYEAQRIIITSLLIIGLAVGFAFIPANIAAKKGLSKGG